MGHSYDILQSDHASADITYLYIHHDSLSSLVETDL